VRAQQFAPQATDANSVLLNHPEQVVPFLAQMTADGAQLGVPGRNLLGPTSVALIGRHLDNVRAGRRALLVPAFSRADHRYRPTSRGRAATAFAGQGHARRRSGCDRAQMLVQTHKARRSLPVHWIFIPRREQRLVRTEAVGPCHRRRAARSA